MPGFRANRGQTWCLNGCYSVSDLGTSPDPADMNHSLSDCSQRLGCANQIEREAEEGGGKGCKREANATALMGQGELLTGSVARMLQVEEVHEGACHDAHLTYQCHALQAYTTRCSRYGKIAM